MKSISMIATKNFLGKWTWGLTVDEGAFDSTYMQSGVVDDWPMALDRMNMAFGQYLAKQEAESVVSTEG